MNSPSDTTAIRTAEERICLTCRQPVSAHTGFRCPDPPEPEYACGECGEPIKTGCYCTRCAKELST